MLPTRELRVNELFIGDRWNDDRDRGGRYDRYGSGRGGDRFGGSGSRSGGRDTYGRTSQKSPPRDIGVGEKENFPPLSRDPPRESRHERERTPSPSATERRPKLELLPKKDPATIPEPAPSSKKPSPFGDAKPRDESAFLKKKEEERMQREANEKTRRDSDSPGSSTAKDSRDKDRDVPRGDAYRDRSDYKPRDKDSRVVDRDRDREYYDRDNRDARQQQPNRKDDEKSRVDSKGKQTKETGDTTTNMFDVLSLQESE